MFVTIDRAAIESAICKEYSASERVDWYTAESRYGVIAVSESWYDVQDAIMEYAERGAENDEDVECQLAECGIRSATDTEVINELVNRELVNVALGAQCSRSIEELKNATIRELVALGYPEDGYIHFDATEPRYNHVANAMRFEVTPLF